MDIYIYTFTHTHAYTCICIYAYSVYLSQKLEVRYWAGNAYINTWSLCFLIYCQVEPQSLNILSSLRGRINLLAWISKNKLFKIQKAAETAWHSSKNVTSQLLSQVGERGENTSRILTLGKFLGTIIYFKLANLMNFAC